MASPTPQLGQEGQAPRERKMVGEYTLVATLGSGSFATVYKAVKKTDDGDDAQIVAIKAISRNSAKITKKVLENLELEISILKNYQHPNIVALKKVHKTTSHFYLYLEFCAGGDLQRLIRTRKGGRLSEGLARRLMRDLTQGLKFLGLQQLIHRDIKPQNLLLTGALPLDEVNDPCKTEKESEARRNANFPTDQFHLKIADFGFARHLQKTSMADTLCGSPLYMAPEILQHQPYDNKADLWSVGTVLFEMITGRPPFHGENHIDLLHNIQRKAVRLPPDLKVSDQCIDLLRILLNRSPKKRAGLSEFVRKSDAFVSLGCKGKSLCDISDVPTLGLNSVAQTNLDRITEGDESQIHETSKIESDGEHQKEQNAKQEIPLVQTVPSRTLPPTLPPLEPSPPGPSPIFGAPCPPPFTLIQGQKKHLGYHPKQDSSSGSDDSEFVLVDKSSPSSPMSPNREQQQLHLRRSNTPTSSFRGYLPTRNLIPPAIPFFPKNSAKKGLLSTSPNTARGIVEAANAASNKNRFIEGNPVATPIHLGSNKLETLKKTLNVADDVGRRAINVAKVGDARAYLGINGGGIASDDSSHNSLTTPMEGVEEQAVKECPSLCSSERSTHGERVRTVSDVDESSYRPTQDEIDDDDDEMPFAMSTPSQDSHKSFPMTSAPKTIDETAQNSSIHFREAFLCYMKALSMLKSSLHASQHVSHELSRITENVGVDSNSLVQLKAQCDRSSVWLSSQFKAVLERADAANIEVRKDGYPLESSGVSGAPNVTSASIPVINVDKLIFDHFLACGREGAVKQLLGHFNDARSCYRSAGLLAESLLMNSNIDVQDKLVLEGYVQGFLDRINEVDAINMSMLQQSKVSIEIGNNSSFAGTRSGSTVMRKGSNIISQSLATQGHQ